MECLGGCPQASEPSLRAPRLELEVLAGAHGRLVSPTPCEHEKSRAGDVDSFGDSKFLHDEVQGVVIDARLRPARREIAGLRVASTVWVGLDLADDELDSLTVSRFPEDERIDRHDSIRQHHR